MNIRTPSASGLALAALLALSAGGAAASDLSYTFIEGGYFDFDIDDPNADGDGFGVGGSVAITEMFHLFGKYGTADLDGPGGVDVDYDTFSFGGGINYPIAERTDLVGQLSYVNAEASAGGFSADDDGFGLYGGVRARLAVPVELEGGISYVDFDEGGDDTAFGARGRYYFTPQWAAGLGVEIGDDVTTWGLTVRWEMPR